MRVFTAILITGCLLASCRASKYVASDESTKESANTGIISKETVKLDTLKVPEQKASISLPSNFFQASGMNYVEKSNGRAKVSAHKVGDTVLLEATCDSLEKIIASTNKELALWQHFALEQMSQKETVKVSNPLWFNVFLGVTGIIGFLNLLIAFLPPTSISKTLSFISKLFNRGKKNK